MEILWFAPIFLLILIGTVWWTSTRSQTLLADWAREHGYDLIESHAPLLNKGPFFWTSSRGQTVYRFTILDAQNRRRSGWARCGSWMWGLMSPQIEVRWDDE